MLAETPSESLTQLLSSVRSRVSPIGSTHIAALDSYLNPDLRGEASAFRHGLSHGDVLEFHGPSASGKTHLLYFFLINCILPQRQSHVPLGGWGKVALVFDMDNGFSMTRLRTMLASRLARLTTSTSNIETIVQQSLGRLYLFRPHSTTQLASTIAHITDNRAGLDLGLIAIDPASARFWVDKFTLEQLKTGPSWSKQTSSQHLLEALQKFRGIHGCVTILTSWESCPISPLPSNTRYFPDRTYHIAMAMAPSDRSETENGDGGGISLFTRVVASVCSPRDRAGVTFYMRVGSDDIWSES